jgi:hypothetical protein
MIVPMPRTGALTLDDFALLASCTARRTACR